MVESADLANPDVQPFSNDGNHVRVVTKDNSPWFVAADVCRILGIDTTQTRRLDDDEKGLYSIQTPGGEQKVVCVNEPGLYSLIFGSRKPEAKAFKRWINHDVLPAIRKTGGYVQDNREEEFFLKNYSYLHAQNPLT